MSKKVSRRQFLTYTLGGTGAFLASGVLFPMVRFVADPLLRKGEGGEFHDVGLSVDEITDTPKEVRFTVHRKDGWYNPPKGEQMTAWVLKLNGEFVALSPVCKHLGCTVNWNSNPQFKNQFFCPCHFWPVHEGWDQRPGYPPISTS